jgi:hypothetical protein
LVHIEKKGKDEKFSYYDGSKMIPKEKLDLKSDGWFLTGNGVKDPACVQAKPIFLKGEKSEEDCKKTCSNYHRDGSSARKSSAQKNCSTPKS